MQTKHTHNKKKKTNAIYYLSCFTWTTKGVFGLWFEVLQTDNFIFPCDKHKNNYGLSFEWMLIDIEDNFLKHVLIYQLNLKLDIFTACLDCRYHLVSNLHFQETSSSLLLPRTSYCSKTTGDPNSLLAWYIILQCT